MIILQLLQFPAKTELKEVHHAHDPATGLEALFCSQHTLLKHPCSLLGMDHFSHWSQGEGDGGIPGASETQARSQHLPCLEVTKVLF